MAASTRRRVSAATSDRPLMTFETVGIDTPVWAAMSAMVVGPALLGGRSSMGVVIASQHNEFPRAPKVSDAGLPQQSAGLTVCRGRRYIAATESLGGEFATFETVRRLDRGHPIER